VCLEKQQLTIKSEKIDFVELLKVNNDKLARVELGWIITL